MNAPERDPDRGRRRLTVATVIVGALFVLVAQLADRSPRTRFDPVSADLSALELNREPATRERQDEALRDVLGYTEFLRKGEPREPQVALTFDDGPSVYTDDILEVLREHDAPATFFVTGEMVAARPELVEQELRDGHAVGAHTYDHANLGQLPPESQAQELTAFDETMRANGLPLSPLFRPPYGGFDAETLRLLSERDALMVLWSVDTGDYENPGWDVIADRALDGAEPGAVILLHDGGGDRAQTLVALPLILKGLRERGLRPVTVPQLLVDDPPPQGQSLESATAVDPPGSGLPGADPAAGG
jgi:peptidoglycan/xylan/chitin deacetylase (PgdA/CDA1 family)